MGSSGPVALNGIFINQAMDDYQIDQDERILFSSTVRRIANIIFSAWAEDAAKKMKSKNK